MNKGSGVLGGSNVVAVVCPTQSVFYHWHCRELSISQCYYCSKIIHTQGTPYLPASLVRCSHRPSLGTVLEKPCASHLRYLLTRGVGYRGVLGA